MWKYNKVLAGGKDILVGVDLHRKSWHVTVVSEDAELLSGSIPPF